MLAGNDRRNATVYELPGRTWRLLLGPENSPAANMTIGYALWPPASSPPPHTHPTQEEIVSVLEGTGTFHSAASQVALAPGTAGYISPGTEHWVVFDPGDTLEFITIFSPPNNPGISSAARDVSPATAGAAS